VGNPFLSFRNAENEVCGFYVGQTSEPWVRGLRGHKDDRPPLKGNLLLGHISLNNHLTKSSQNANFSTEIHL